MIDITMFAIQLGKVCYWGLLFSVFFFFTLFFLFFLYKTLNPWEFQFHYNEIREFVNEIREFVSSINVTFHHEVR